MAEIRPFHGIHYNPAVVKDLAAAICPPYDVISPRLQQELYELSDTNFVRIECGKEQPQDNEFENRYTRAAATLEQWLNGGVLQTDTVASLYLHDHYFSIAEKAYRRRNLNCLVKLEEWDKGIVRPHEGTSSKARSDRLSLLWALKANTSPIMGMYQDRDELIAGLFEKQSDQKPLLSTGNSDGDRHELRQLTDTGLTRKVQELLADQPLYIADGHHRYESALAYQRERHTIDQTTTGNQPYDFVMMNLVSFTDPGLVVLPAHRLLRGITTPVLHKLRGELESCFAVEEHTPEADIANQVARLLSEHPKDIRLALYGLKAGKLLVLTTRDFEAIRPMIPLFHSEIYQKLDVSIMNHVILEKMLGLAPETMGTHLDYTNNTIEAVNAVNRSESQLAFLLRPVQPGIIKAIADIGDRMPPKSTYFYPKIPSGLVFYRSG